MARNIEEKGTFRGPAGAQYCTAGRGDRLRGEEQMSQVVPVGREAGVEGKGLLPSLMSTARRRETPGLSSVTEELLPGMFLSWLRAVPFVFFLVLAVEYWTEN